MSVWDWTFYTDSYGRHHWQRLCQDGSVLFESDIGFTDRQTCVRDAAEHGYDGTESPRTSTGTLQAGA